MMSSGPVPDPSIAPSSRVRPCWSTGKPPNRLAALPAGLLGRVGGTIMRRGNARQQQEVMTLLDGVLGPADGTGPADVVEVGTGPGVLLGTLSRRRGIGHLTGLDPSPRMRITAVRSLAPAVADGRVRIRPGQAERTGLPDDVADLVVSVNTVAIWPDLDAGLDELARILRPGAHLVLSWHGGHTPTRSGAAMALTDPQVERLQRGLASRFVDLRRELTPCCTVFVARRCPERFPHSSEGPRGSSRDR